MTNKNMSKAGKKILAAMENVIAYIEGDESKCMTSIYKIQPKTKEEIVVDVPKIMQEIRTSLEMNRSQFAEAFHFTKYSVRNWESGERKPPEYCLAYLRLISKDPWKAYQDLHPSAS